jgi:hypothetical protein
MLFKKSYQGNLVKTGKFGGNSKEVQRKFRGSSGEVPRKFGGSSEEVRGKFRGNFEGVPRKFGRSSEEV